MFIIQTAVGNFPIDFHIPKYNKFSRRFDEMLKYGSEWTDWLECELKRALEYWENDKEFVIEKPLFYDDWLLGEGTQHGQGN